MSIQYAGVKFKVGNNVLEKSYVELRFERVQMLRFFVFVGICWDHSEIVEYASSLRLRGVSIVHFGNMLKQ